MVGEQIEINLFILTKGAISVSFDEEGQGQNKNKTKGRASEFNGQSGRGLKRRVVAKRVSELDGPEKILEALFSSPNSQLSDQYLRWKIWSRWEYFVGPEWAPHTQPVGFVQGRLVVWVDHPTRLQEILFVQDLLTQSINQKLGKVWIRKMQFTRDKRGIDDSDSSRARIDDAFKTLKK